MAWEKCPAFRFDMDIDDETESGTALSELGL
jgi:hypothetical protein